MEVSVMLKAARENWELELAKLEDELRPKLAKVAELRNQIAHATQLITSLESSGHQAAAEPIDPLSKSDQRFTPTQAYWVPILEALVEIGGKGTVERVLKIVEKKMTNIFTSADLQKLPNNSQLRWENRTNWQRLNMVKQGLLKTGSPRGLWEISDAGRDWLRLKKRSA